MSKNDTEERFTIKVLYGCSIYFKLKIYAKKDNNNKTISQKDKNSMLMFLLILSVT